DDRRGGKDSDRTEPALRDDRGGDDDNDGEDHREETPAAQLRHRRADRHERSDQRVVRTGVLRLVVRSHVRLQIRRYERTVDEHRTLAHYLGPSLADHAECNGRLRIALDAALEIWRDRALVDARVASF